MKFKRAFAGFSMIELLIAVAIGLIIMAGVVQVVVNTKQNKVLQEEVAFIEDNSRFAIDYLTNEIRMAGYMGCASASSAKVANSISNSLGGFIGTGAVEGFEGEVSTASFPSSFKVFAKTGTDALIIRRGDSNSELNVKSHNAASATIHLWGNHNYPKGSTLMIADSTCRHIGLFQLSGPNSVSASLIVHDTGAGTNHCTKIIKGSFTCASSPCGADSCGGYGITGGDYTAGSKIMGFSAGAYFIGTSVLSSGLPALKRQVIDISTSTGVRIEELAPGVEAMDIYYGVDTNADGDVNQYLKASQMDTNSDGVINLVDWDKVKSLRVSLTFRSQNPVYSANETHTLNGVTYTDRYLRQASTLTVVIRNRN